MATVTFELDEQVADSIRRLARERNRSENEILAEAVALYAREGERPKPKGIGKYRSGRSDVSEQAEAILRKAVEDGEWP